jgi:addiction module RelE/StbE family toxin
VSRRRVASRGEARGPLQIRWTHRALSDLESIADYSARDNPAAAERHLARLLEPAERAACLPLAGRRVPEMGREDIREALVRGYRLVYRVAGRRLEVLTVFEGHRRLPPGVK